MHVNEETDWISRWVGRKASDMLNSKRLILGNHSRISDQGKTLMATYVIFVVVNMNLSVLYIPTNNSKLYFMHMAAVVVSTRITSLEDTMSIL